MDENDITRVKAEALVNACNGLGLTARLHWDRSPWCCQVALTQVHHADFDEYTPSIFFMLEDSDSYFIMGHGANAGTRIGVRWHGAMQIGGDLPEQNDLDDIHFEILERTWLGDDEHTTAHKIAMLVSMIDISALPVPEDEDA
jgi:hypothetical protein